MKTKNKNRKLNVILDDYNKILNDYKLSQSEDVKEQINLLQQEALISVEQEKKDNKELGFALLFLLSLFIILSIYSFLAYTETENLKTDNNTKVEIIESYEQMNSSFKEIDSLRSQTDSLYRKILNITYDTAGTRYISYSIKNGKIVSYHDLEVENKALERQNNNLLDKIDYLESKLDLVQRNYKIYFIEDENNITIKAEQIDSALMILPFYKDKLKYNADKKEWTITHSKKE